MDQRFKRLLCVLITVLLVLQNGILSAADANDRAADPESYSVSSWLPWINLPTTVSNMIKRPLEKGVVYLDKHKVYDKTDHIIDTLKTKGVYPVWFDINNENFIQDGVSFRNGVYSSSKYLGMTGAKYERPITDKDILGGELGTSSWARYQTWNNDADFGTRLSLANIADIDLYTAVTARYQKNRKEKFYGVGRHYNVDDKYDFSSEETSIDYIIGKEHIIPNVAAELGVGYSNVNISEGRVRHKPNIDLFPGGNGQPVSGLDGAELLSYGASLIRDTRNDRLQPTDGGYESVGMTMNHGVGGDDQFRYWKLRGDAVRYLPLYKFIPKLSQDKTIVLRGAVERNSDVSDKEIPFFDLARLDRDEVRGYNTNRFFDKNLMSFTADYRYTVWKWKDMKMDASLFYDFGWSFAEFSKLRGSEVKDGYGLALRILLPATNVIQLEAARCDEGYQVLLKWKPRF
jgi:hypothetical protein